MVSFFWNNTHISVIKIGTPSPLIPVCFVEGYATAASIHETTNYPVVMCFDAGNIKPVVNAWRKKYPQQNFIICADNDQWKKENVGVDRASEQLMTFLKETVTALLVDKQVSRDVSQQLAIDLAEQLRLEWESATVYIPITPDLTARNKNIIAEFNGTNQQALSRKYKLSEQSIYQILRENTKPPTNTAKV